MPPATQDNVEGVIEHVVTEKDAFLAQLPALVEANLVTGDIANEEFRAAYVRSEAQGLDRGDAR